MNITVSTQALAYELGLLNKVVPTKPTLPVLGYVVLRAEMGALTLSATDLEVAMVSTCEAQIVEPGAVTLPAKKLLDLLQEIADPLVTLAEDQKQVRITAGAFTSRLQTINLRDVPTLPHPEGMTTAVHADWLATLIQKTLYAIAEKSTKYILDGALFIQAPELMTLVALDGKRLSLASAPHVQPHPVPSVILPRKTLDILLAHCETETELQYSASDKHLFFKGHTRLLISRTIDGQFPNYEPIIPKANGTPVMTIERKPLAAALRRVGVLSEENQAVDCSCEGSVFRLTSNHAGVGDADEHVAMTYAGPPLTFCTNGRFMLDFLEHATGSSVTLEADGSRPLLLKDGANFLNVVTVMKR